ncbi:pentapeptide repeat-containing protein [Micromonospora arborensis]|uniref:pentapeptide repeat-containing protein n=1 Tax=Micromonospora arborensis TaxID=2116518 RepID=UPI0033F7FE5F
MELPAENPPPSPTALSVPPVPVADSPVPALKLWEIRRSIGLSILAALLVVVGLIVGAFWYAGFPSVDKDGTVTTGTLFDLLKLVFAVVAGLGGVAALVVAYRRQRVAEHTNRLAEFAHELAHAADGRAEVTKALAEAADERAKIEVDRNGVRLFNERFAKASEQLGSEKAAIRLAGVYAMAGLADDWREGRQTCIDVLCAYLRMPYTAPPPTSGDGSTSGDHRASQKIEEAARAAREEREVRHTVIRLVSRHLRLEPDDASSWRGYDFDFTGAVFDGGDFAGVTFSGGTVLFVNATFSGGTVLFSRATFSGGEVVFSGATFSSGRVFFTGAAFSGGRVTFELATFSGVKVNFDRATFSAGAEVIFRAATFSAGTEVRFMQATFSGGRVSFYRAAFTGGVVSFRSATLFSDPPEFDTWPTGEPPAGLLLPEV